ncbi:MAG TPA: ABC transporter substrate-binding protein [Burkholderiales bacterium]|nr:ABC transporter substrate-binding protein [Burkholderiales bacterium]
MRKSFVVALTAAIALAAGSASAQEKVVLGMSGWTGFQPLKLAELAGIFKKNGVDIEIRFIPPVQRSAALAAGSLNAAATTVDQHIVWTSAGINTVQVALIDKSNGGDGLAVRNNINSVKELKGKTINVDGPGTVQHFMLSYILEKNGMTIQDVIRVTMGAQPAAQAFVAGQSDAALTYEPYLSTVRAKPDQGKIIVTSKDYPVVVDVLVFKKDFLDKNPKTVKATVDSFFEALDMIKREPAKAYEMMGSTVKQPGEAFAKSASFIAWQDRAANKAYYAKEHKPFVDFAVRVLKFNRVIQKEPKAAEMIDLRFQ